MFEVFKGNEKINKGSVEMDFFPFVMKYWKMKKKGMKGLLFVYLYFYHLFD